jgi:hypothetical protein
MDVACERQVVLREEVEGICVHDGEAFCGEFIDTARCEVFVERQGCISQFADTPANSLPETFFRAAPPYQGLFMLQTSEAFSELCLEFLQALQRCQFVFRQ